MNGHLDIVSFLVNQPKIDINAKDSISNNFFFIELKYFIYLWNYKLYFNYTALHLSSEKGYIEIVRVLLKQKDIDINCRTILTFLYFNDKIFKYEIVHNVFLNKKYSFHTFTFSC